MNNKDWEHFKKTVNPLKDQKKIIRKQHKTLETIKKKTLTKTLISWISKFLKVGEL